MAESKPVCAGAILAQLRALGVLPAALVNDSRRVQPGDIFVAYPGERVDGRDFIAHAVSAGAAAVLWESDGYQWTPQCAAPNIDVRGLRVLAGEIAGELAGNPSRELWMVGVTGTNGKTSCSQWIAAALTQLGRPTAVVGTLGHGFPGALTALANTTPDAIALHSMLRHYRDKGAQCAAMEVSSHGLAQDRLSGVRFDVALFTNLTRDHLDYHGDMRSYGEAKARLFDWPGLACAVINIDDEFGRRLVARLEGGETQIITYGLAGGTIAGHRLDLDRFGLELEIRTPWGAGKLTSRLLGAYNAANLLGVLGVLLASDVSLQPALDVLAQLLPVEGRMQALGGGDQPLVVVDYAHTPDALEQVLIALRAHLRSGKLVLVFGCGGDRDRGKRPAMGEIASRLADRVVVTSDNPRSEQPQSIIDQIVAGARGAVRCIPDRAAAIATAIREAESDDVILLAGKGHERWQEIGSTRLPFSDADIAQRCLQAWQRSAGRSADSGGARA
jgi:UDP-N-acetylmuramoyl-L-alanyl-D-glutamate--2,6-diaminopimelate ligase